MRSSPCNHVGVGWSPLSRRESQEPERGPVEGLPPYLFGPVKDWILSALVEYDSYGELHVHSLDRFQVKMALDPPLARLAPRDLLNDLSDRMEGDPEFTLDLADYILHEINRFWGDPFVLVQKVEEIKSTLDAGRSVWEPREIREANDLSFELVRRDVGPVRETIASLSRQSRVHHHLVTALDKLTSRDPDPSGAYREAIRAVEAAAKPVILPGASLATLGTMIRAIEDKPEKWETTIGSIEGIQADMEAVWTSQLDRHGTDDESVPLSVSPEQADAAFAICLSLTRLFVNGHVRRV